MSHITRMSQMSRMSHITHISDEVFEAEETGDRNGRSSPLPQNRSERLRALFQTRTVAPIGVAGGQNTNGGYDGPAAAVTEEEDDDSWKVVINDLEFSDSRRYATNAISTAKYSVLTFLPQNIFEQFLRVANFYFLVLLILQLIPQITSLSPVTTALPLFLVLGISAAKDGYDDFQRHRSDRTVNNRMTTVVTAEGPSQTVPWKSVRVGSILKLENDDFVAADILVLRSSEPNGLCFVETAELDGETNLKVKQTVNGLSQVGELTAFKGVIRCEKPNNVLDKFEGALHVNGETLSLDNSNMLLRGCKLRNTKWTYGVVVFAGPQTKLMQNSGKAHFKRTKLDRLMNTLILFIFGFLLFLSIVGAVGSSIWENIVGPDFLDYIPYDPADGVDNAHATAALQFFSYLIVLNALVPISLYVSVEFIRMGQSLLINWDQRMYSETTDTAARARTTTLNEELGQIEYIFTDKTGTLTQNHMRFLMCSINGTLYGGDGNNDQEQGVAPGKSVTTLVDDIPTSGAPTNAQMSRSRTPLRMEPSIIEDQSDPDAQERQLHKTGSDSGVGTQCSSVSFNKDDPLLPGQIPDTEADAFRQSKSSDLDMLPNMANMAVIFSPGHESSSPASSTSGTATARISGKPSARARGGSPAPPKAALFVNRQSSASSLDVEQAWSRSKVDRSRSMLSDGSLEASSRKTGLDFTTLSRYGEAAFKFSDMSLVRDARNTEQAAFEFFHALALCHTVMAEQGTDDLVYQAQSPDEAALVSAARNFGIAFVDRTPNTIIVDIHGEVCKYQLICILDFNNVRKRMSVIVRCPDDRLMLYSKGADNVIFERCQYSLYLMDTMDQLEGFASDGLRTLCVAKKELSEDALDKWRLKHHAANISLVDRHQKLDKVYEEIEKDLELIGASAIEDRLQDQVPETIANLSRANIKIWVLTGDKEETAINIGYSCRLLTVDTDVFVVEGVTFNEVRTSLRRIKGLINCGRDAFTRETGIKLTDEEDPFEDPGEAMQKPRFAMVINGHSLTHALTLGANMLFLETACLCRAIICCRVTPLQKAQVVELVKEHKRAITLAIGDGANDVGMIKAAQIGVGISGKEGMQAVLASDYSLGQFKYLERLVLIHGRWSYMRMCKFLAYFFYKNFAFVLVQFWYAFFCGFTAQTVYDPWFISVYNLIFTSLPVIALGIIDQDVSEAICLKYPRLYIPGQQNLLFNRTVFFRSLVRGVYVSMVVYFVTHLAFDEAVDTHGKPIDPLYVFGTAASGLLVWVVNVQVALDTYHWTVLNFIVIVVSVLSWYIFVVLIYLPRGIYSAFPTLFYDIAVHVHLLGTAPFWLALLLGTAICILPVIAHRLYSFLTRPFLVELIRDGYEPPDPRQAEQQQRPESATPQPDVLGQPSTPASPASSRRGGGSFKRGMSSRRHRRVASVGSTATTATTSTGYAFSHMQGFGELITSGRAFLGNLVTPLIGRLNIASSSTSSPAARAPSSSDPVPGAFLAQACTTALTIAAPRASQAVSILPVISAAGPATAPAVSPLAAAPSSPAGAVPDAPAIQDADGNGVVVIAQEDVGEEDC